MSWQRSSAVETLPDDPVGEAVGEAIGEILRGAAVDLVYAPEGTPLPAPPNGSPVASATGAGPPGWDVRLTVRLAERRAPLLAAPNSPLLVLLNLLPGAGLRAMARLEPLGTPGSPPLSPGLLRALRDTVVIEALTCYPGCVPPGPGTAELIAETLEYLVELSGTRVESHELTHGVVITDVLEERPRLRFAYPADLRTVKRAPLLFDGQRSVLVVDTDGLARTELQSHRIDRLSPGGRRLDASEIEFADSGSLVATATRRLGGIGFFLRADRTIWVFAGGEPLLMRRAAHWRAFPLELAAAIASATGTSRATADIVVQAALIISAQRHGAILAIVDDPDALDGVVAPKDRYDLRNAFDPMAMRPETRLHHLIDAAQLDARTLARFAALDGATIVDRSAHLIAYGAIVTSSGSQFEGARTAAAKTLSHTAEIVLNVSADGDITVFREGEIVATLLQ